MHRPPIIYHSSPSIYHRPDVVVHHPDIVIHRPSVVVQPPSVVIHKPAVVYHQPPVVFHQPEPAIHQPVYHSHDSYEAHPVYTHVGSHLDHGGKSIKIFSQSLSAHGVRSTGQLCYVLSENWTSRCETKPFRFDFY